MTKGQASFERERAKRLCAAFQSMRMGTAFATEYKRIGDGPLGDFWYIWADYMERQLVEGLAKQLGFDELSNPQSKH